MKNLKPRCSICLVRKDLTEEHIFPKGLTVPGTRQIRDLIPKIDPDKRYRKATRLSQNGLKLKTTCSRCNNYLLGKIYDPALKHLYDETSIYLRNAHMLPSKFFKIENIELNKLARAVLGHMLAADTKPNPRAAKSREMRRFFFNHSHVLSPEYSLLMWLYPSREQAIIRDIFIVEHFGRHAEETVWSSVYKTFPLAFSFTHRSIRRELPYKGILDLTSFLTSNIDETFNITFSLKDIPHQVWPEMPGRNGAILMGEGQKLLTKPHISNRQYQH